MKRKLIALLILVSSAFFVSACAGGRLAATSWPGITYANETVFVSFGPYVYALQASNGSLEWRFPAEQERNVSFFAPPALTRDGQLIVGGYDNVLYSINPDTGQPNAWKFTEAKNRYIAGPLTTENSIFAPSADGNLYALDLQGNPLWPPFETEEPIWATPSLDGQTIYLASLDHNLYAIEAQSGRKIWNQDLGGAVVSAPTVGADGVIYVGTFANNVQARDAQNGTLRWTFDTSDWVWSSPTLAGDTLYFGDISGTFYAVDAATGNEKWQFTADTGIFGSPLLSGDTIYLATEGGTLYALTTDGEQLWTRQFEGKIYTGPVAAQDLILLSTIEAENLILAVDGDGNTQWSFAPDNG